MLARTFFAAFILLAAQPASAEDWFDCSVNHSFQLDDGGFLEEQRVSAFMRRNHPGFVERSFSFDRDSGKYVEGSIDWTFLIVQEGDRENSMKAFRLVEGTATNVMQTLQINTFSENEFLFVFGDEVHAGYCAQRSTSGK